MKQLALRVLAVAFYDVGTWQTWKPHAAFETYPDLFTGLEFDDFDHVWRLLFSTKELEQNELRRVTQKDTQKLAHRTGKLFEPTEILNLQSHVEAADKPCQKAPKPSQPRQTRMEMIHALVASQQGPQPGVHHLKLDRAYLRCTECKSYILARTNEEAFNRFVGEPCRGPLEPSLWLGHVTQTMKRTGQTVECSRCHARTRMSGEQVTLTARLRGRCTVQKNQDLRQMFA